MVITYSCPYAVGDEIAVRYLARVGDQNFELGILVQDLLDASIVATLLRL